MYAALKLLHVGAVVLSGLGFVIRYRLSVTQPWMTGALIRVAPHVVDTVLLASALSLAWVGGFNPLRVPWLDAKLGGLVVYILVGTIALKRGRTRRIRETAFVAALLAYAYIVSAALTKSPLGPLAGGLQ
ncbi:MAG: SirB2 family protein [Burkholderiaceae bacterium]